MSHEADFPKTDISDETAEVLELLLLNRELVGGFHENAERAHALYRMGHGALHLASKPNIEGDRLAAFSYGIGTLEAIRLLVRPTPSDLSEYAAGLKVAISTNALATDFVDTIVDAEDKFATKLPRTRQLIGQSATRFFPLHANYAISGAAMARDLEMQDIPG